MYQVRRDSFIAASLAYGLRGAAGIVLACAAKFRRG